MIDLRHPQTVLANRMPWQEIEPFPVQRWARLIKTGKKIEYLELFGPIFVGQILGFEARRVAHARQFKRMRKVINVSAPSLAGCSARWLAK